MIEGAALRFLSFRQELTSKIDESQIFGRIQLTILAKFWSQKQQTILIAKAADVSIALIWNSPLLSNLSARPSLSLVNAWVLVLKRE